MTMTNQECTTTHETAVNELITKEESKILENITIYYGAGAVTK